jgi:hypothetical protein
MLFDLLFYGAVLVPVVGFAGRKLGWLWVRALVFAVLAPYALLQVFIDFLMWKQTEGFPPWGPMHGVHPYLELRVTFPYEDGRCPPSGG